MLFSTRRTIFLVLTFATGIVAFSARHRIQRLVLGTEETYRSYYDDSTAQKPVLTHVKLDSILNALDSVYFTQLPDYYIENTQSNSMKDVLQWKKYYVVRGMDVFAYVVGNFRISEFMSKDSFFDQNLSAMPSGSVQYWLTDRRLLHKFLDLLLWMRKNGYNDSAISLKHGHRNPGFNKTVGGVSRSYHQQGMAVDIRVGDINRDGEANQTDKNILLEVLENEIIADSGGIGKYPGSDVIHFDTRGVRARWNEH